LPRKSSPARLAQYWSFRDMRAAAGHFSFSVDAQLPPWGLVALGGEFHSPTL